MREPAGAGSTTTRRPGGSALHSMGAGRCRLYQQSGWEPADAGSTSRRSGSRQMPALPQEVAWEPADAGSTMQAWRGSRQMPARPCPGAWEPAVAGSTTTRLNMRPARPAFSGGLQKQALPQRSGLRAVASAQPPTLPPKKRRLCCQAQKRAKRKSCMLEHKRAAEIFHAHKQVMKQRYRWSC